MKLRIWSGDGVAAKQECALATSNKAMEEKSAVALSEYDVVPARLIDGAGFDFDYVSGPKSGQHTFSADPHAETTGLA